MAALTGSCLCGAVHYQSTSASTFTAICHCLDCQKWTGGAFTSNAVVPTSAFSITKGEPKHFDINGDSGKNNRHFFCGTCGSSLYSMPEAMGDVVCIKGGGLDNGQANFGNKVDAEIYCKDRVTYLEGIKGVDQKAAMT